jgi:enoyl-CoA hydratase/carnithine racemase
MPGLRNLERRLLRVQRQLAPPIETKIPVTLLRATLEQMDHADRQRIPELDDLTREQIRRRIADDHDFRTFLRRAIGFAMRPPKPAVAADDSQNDVGSVLAGRRGFQDGAEDKP